MKVKLSTNGKAYTPKSWDVTATEYVYNTVNAHLVVSQGETEYRLKFISEFEMRGFHNGIAFCRCKEMRAGGIIYVQMFG